MAVKELKPIVLNKYSGRNTFSEITNLDSTQFRSLINIDVFQGNNGDYLKTRRGSDLLIPGSPAKMPAMNNKVVFPVAGVEYLILSTDETFAPGLFYGVQLPGNPILITGPSGEDFTIPFNSGPPDMCVYNDRVYVFHQSGNKVVYWDADAGKLIGRPMGLQAPAFNSFNNPAVPSDMTPSSVYTYGIEKVIQKNDADYLASSPNRKFTDGEIKQIASGGVAIGLYTTTSDLAADTYWTHLRLWRTKTLTPDFTDPLFPLDAQGTIDQLWEVALITRAEAFGTFGPIATGDNLPAGNAGVSAGINGADVEIQDTNNDTVLVNVIGLYFIDLIPIPGCRTGAVNKGRVFSAGIGDDFISPLGPKIDPVIREDVLYTTQQVSQYQEQWDPQAYLDAGRDGNQTASIQVFGQDVLIFRQSQTKRIQSGNPDSGIQMVDDKIGVPTFRMTGYITKLGICAICSDAYFRYFGFDFKWHQYIGKIEISQSIYDLTLPVFEFKVADFVYMNGKLLMLLPFGSVGSLGVKEGKGWSLFQYSDDTNFSIAFNYEKGAKAALGSNNRYLLQIETGSDSDADVTDTSAPRFDVVGSFEGSAFSGQGGILEPIRYSFWGKLSTVPTVMAKSSNQTWQMQSGFVNPGLFAANPDYNEREYIFQASPQTNTPFAWTPLRGQFISFTVSVVGPAMISWQKLTARIRATNGNLGVSASGGIIPQGPGWANQDLMLLNFEDPADIFFDASGKGIDHDWVANGGTKINRVSQQPGKGVSITNAGYLISIPDTVLASIGVSNLAWKACFSFPSGGNFTASGKVGDSFWYLKANASGAYFAFNNGVVAYTWTYTGALALNTVYALTFTLKKTFIGQFFIDAVSASTFNGPLSTVRTNTANPPSSAIQIVGAYAPHLSNLVLMGWDHSTLYGTYYSGSGHTWYLWASAAERDAANPDTTVAYVPMLNEAATLPIIEQNGSGISGTVDNYGSNVGDDGNLDVIYGNALITGNVIKPIGIVSYYEIDKADPGAQQSEQFWRMIRSY